MCGRIGSVHRTGGYSPRPLRCPGPTAPGRWNRQPPSSSAPNSGTPKSRACGSICGRTISSRAPATVLSDVAWNNGTSQGPWWLLHGLASIGSYGLGGYAAQHAAEAAKSLPRAVLAQQPAWLALMPDIGATGDVHVLRDVYST